MGKYLCVVEVKKFLDLIQITSHFLLGSKFIIKFPLHNSLILSCTHVNIQTCVNFTQTCKILCRAPNEFFGFKALEWLLLSDRRSVGGVGLLVSNLRAH